MEVRCPLCHTPINPGTDSLTSELMCTGCGGTFTLAGDDEAITLRDGKPRTVGRFVLLERIGAGSFGTVWRAHDDELDRTVAVKIPRRGSLDSAGAQRFLREAQAAAQLHHPSIVPVHEVGRDDDTLDIVSQFVHGATLKDRLADYRFTPEEAAVMCVQIADGLEHAHRAGVIHRDLKPSNILIDAEGLPHLVDFGLARRDVGDVTMTLEGRLFGTPAYAPPEQVRGEASQSDSRSDVYSLGVVLFELLTGELPFRGNIQMIVQQVLQDDAPSPRSFNGNVPKDLETICLKCLEKAPPRRYQSAAELRDDLQRYLDGEPIHARPVNSLERGKKWTRRHPAISFLLACIVLLTVTGVTIISWQWRKAMAAQQNHARTQVDLVLNAEPEVVASVISTLDGFRPWVDPALKQLLSRKDLSGKQRYRANLALLPIEPEREEYIFQQLVGAEDDPDFDAAELVCGARVLRGFHDQTDAVLWETLEDPGTSRSRQTRAALVLVILQGNSPGEAFKSRLESLAPSIVDGLLQWSVAAPRDFSVLVEAMRPVGALLLPPLEQRLVDDGRSANIRLAATSFFGEYAESDFDRLASVLLQVEGEQYAGLLPFAKRHSSQLHDRLNSLMNGAAELPPTDDAGNLEWDRRAAAAVTLMHLGLAGDEVWPLLKPSADTRLRTSLIHRFAELGFPQQLLAERILRELQAPSESAGILRALILSLCEYSSPDPGTRQTLARPLTEAYRRHPDSGTHSAIDLLVRRWGYEEAVETMTPDSASIARDPQCNWYVNSEGITLAVVRDPSVFLMGSEETELYRDPEERLHWRKIDRDFAIGTTEITASQFMRYSNHDSNCNYVHRADYGPDPNGPAIGVTWVQAAKYCRWLSEIENIPEDQMCFPELSEIEGGMALPGDYLQRTGYRLPTDGEWEYACRAGTVTTRFYGNGNQRIGRYGWYIENSRDRAWHVGLLLPNDLGLFDVYGNVWEWCVDQYGKLPMSSYNAPFLDTPKLDISKGYVLRGGSITNRAAALRSAERDFLGPDHTRNHNVGFRVARTMPNP